MPFTYPETFNPQPRLAGDGLVIRPLVEDDRAPLAKAASDPLIWAGHPAHDRHQRSVFDRYFDTLSGFGGAMTIATDEDATIGCSVYYTERDTPSRLSIGYTFLTREHWGGRTNRSVKGLMLAHLFSDQSEAWFHIAATNIRSQIATQRLGARHMHDAHADLGAGPQSWKCYALTREAWAEKQKEWSKAP